MYGKTLVGRSHDVQHGLKGWIDEKVVEDQLQKSTTVNDKVDDRRDHVHVHEKTTTPVVPELRRMARDERMNPECHTEIELLQSSDHLLGIGKFPAIELEQTLGKDNVRFVVRGILSPCSYVMRCPIVIDADLRAWKVASDDFLGEREYFLRVDLLLELSPCRPDRFDDHTLIGRRRWLADMSMDHRQMKVTHVDVLYEFVLKSMGNERSLTVRRPVF